MTMEGAERLAALLRERGYSVSIEAGEQVELRVEKGSVAARVILAGKAAALDKLYVRAGRGGGVTVIDCSNIERVRECVERLLRALESSA